MSQKMRLLTLTLLAALLLAACGTQQPAPTDNTADSEGLLAEAVPTDDATATPVPTPTPEGTEDPDEGLIFDWLTLTRSGGISGDTYTVTVVGNGALLIDDQLLGSISDVFVSGLDSQLDTMGFFRLDAHYGPIEAGADTFSYELTVNRNGQEKTVSTVDGHMPTAIQRLVDDVLGLQPTGPVPAATAPPADS